MTWQFFKPERYEYFTRVFSYILTNEYSNNKPTIKGYFSTTIAWILDTSEGASDLQEEVKN